MSSFFEHLGNLAVLIALYVAACVVLATDLLDLPTNALVVAGAGALTISVYLLDRVKLADRFLDPADAMAHPQRAAYMRRRAAPLRGLLIVLAGLAFFVLWQAGRWIALLVPLSHLGVVIYAHAPRPIRPKDRLVVKNGAVALSITALVVLLIAGTEVDLWDQWSRVLTVAVFLAAHVFADAMLCDLDDAESDRRHGTRTFANVFGRRATWRVATALNLLAAAIIVTSGLLTLVDRRAALVYGTLLPLTLVLLRLTRAAHLRDLVDARLPLCVGAGWVILRLLAV